jgi:cobalt-zinc-cadmium efflux system membrane fusion protein
MFHRDDRRAARQMTRGGAAALLAAALGASCTPAAAPALPAAAADAPSARDLVMLDAAAQQHAGIVVQPARLVAVSAPTEAPALVALDESRTARIGSLVDGSVVQVLVQPGMHVRASQVLANLHSHVVHDSWAGYRKAKADERRLVTELRYAVDAQERAERLYADKAIALQELQRARANRVAAVESLDMARTEVRRAEEELEHLGITNSDDPTGESGEQSAVRSPYAGVVLERLVTPGTAVIAGTPMFIVSDLSTVWILAEIDEARLGSVRVGDRIAARVAAYPDDVFAGAVTYIGETINPKTRRVTVRCEVPNPDGRLKPEMYASVGIGGGDTQQVVAVPGAAIQTVEGRTTVFVNEADGRFRARAVQVGREQNGLVEVRDGLRAGEPIVTAGAFILKSELLTSAARAGE